MLMHTLSILRQKARKISLSFSLVQKYVTP